MDFRKINDVIAGKIMLLVGFFVLSLTFLIAFGLLQRAAPILFNKPLGELLFSNVWRPAQGKFGMAGFIAGSIYVTAIAMVIAVPLSILTALHLAEYANKKVRGFLKPLVDLLAGISPVIYGVWGVIVIVPLVRDYLIPFCNQFLPFPPFVSNNFTGFSALAAGIVLAVMVFPIIIAVAEEVIRTVPFEMREAAMALGATKWQTIKYVVLRKAWPGIIAAVILGLSRAFGETMAVLMVAGCNLHDFPRSIFDAAYPLPALIANTYGEMMSIPLYDSAVLLAALMLLIVTMLFNAVGWAILFRVKREGT